MKPENASEMLTETALRATSNTGVVEAHSSSIAETSTEVTSSNEAVTLNVVRDDWRVWLRQTSKIVRFELRKIFFSRRAVLVYLLALAPPVLFALAALIIKLYPPRDVEFGGIGQAPLVFAAIYQTLILRTVIFFGCAWLFMNLFRGEVVDRSLHYYFLAPVRREVLVVAKFFAGLIASVILFNITTLGSMFFMYSTRQADAVGQYFLTGGGMQQAFSYIGITCLACAGYGAIFLVVGLIFRNPIIPALVIYGWEFINFLLPPVLKSLSVIFYLESLLPIKISEGRFAFVAESAPAALSIFGLLLLVCALLIVAARKIKRTEIRYGDE